MSKYLPARYYQKNKEKNVKRIIKYIKILLNREREYGCEQYRNLSEDEKQRLVEYRKR